MFNNSNKILFMIIMMVGTLITVTSNSWLGAWMGLEINLLSFIPLMSDNNNLMSTEASLKYFLVQALASAVLLFAIILMMLKNNLNFEINSFIILPIMLSSLLMKSGSAPFHFWFPNIMEGLTWSNCLLLMTWQKIAPLMLISNTNMKSLLYMSILMSVIIGCLGGLNQSSLRKLMAFSSINHLGWMLSALMMNETIWMIYFIMYTFLSFTLIYMFNSFKIFHFNQLFSLLFESKILKFCLFLNFLSLGGLPPFLGFMPKWLIIQQLTMNSQYFLLIVLLMSTLITLFFYLRICYSAFMLNYYENNWNWIFFTNYSTFYMHLILSFFSIFGLILISMLYFMF
uniref:NADH-ubiquinone oxidoreductase chain 2 n=1 Tax=Stegana chuanjiangi TaxID=2174957 RepID=A0A6M2R7D1_9MUSC|nr:NADH dehydrogenase subunit 2 [Stegana chuanjiangi]QBF00249.1 NADH dehydrogenase subunit 2 [Stegana chuanjiangi]QBF00250.1 NADH dehydrogenase subunit 2 [Stegana chuanjiangi]QBF00251.1 NADH dehydrogenase subunit 2 [Stegana chuanjiangi]QBF00252.1 NADH dehydrogenase subunit 2 [Stegana chuanjiangi]